MKLMTMSELSNRTRAELMALLETVSTALGDLPEGSDDHAAAEGTLDNIRATLARRTLSASRPGLSPRL